MSPERESRGHADHDYDDPDYGEEIPRSVFSTTWFRALLVVVVLAVVGVLALPYLLDWVGPTRLTPAVKGPVVSVPSPPRPAAQPDGGQAVSPPPGAARVVANPPEPKTERTAPAPPPSPDKMARAPGRTEPAAVEMSKPGSPKPPPAVEQMRPDAAKGPRMAKAPAPGRAGKTQLVAVSGGPYWVQVGAFHAEAHARALAARLHGADFPAEVVAGGGGASAARAEPATSTPAGDKYDVFVSGTSSEDVNTKIAAKGLSAEPVAGGAVIKPSLTLRDAVSLSKDLASEGLKVQVRRALAGAAAERPAARGGGTIYRVRVGGFPDRTAADEARKALSARGYTGFIGRGGG
jgi:cell division septation protein DedD